MRLILEGAFKSYKNRFEKYLINDSSESDISDYSPIAIKIRFGADFVIPPLFFSL